MDKINWKVRLKNKNFWLALVPALALLAQAFTNIFNFKLEFGETVDKILVFDEKENKNIIMQRIREDEFEKNR